MTSRAKLSAHECVPRDARALLIGRVWVPAEQGPSVVAVRGDDVVDLTPSYLTVSQLLNVAAPDELRAAIKCPPMAAVGLGARVGIHPASVWSNPEPELVLVVNHGGVIVGVTLGNDVNLRDVEGRSALLLGRAKDNNASCAVGPFVRVLDDAFTLDSARRLSFETMVEGLDGFRVKHTTHVAEISRDLADLAAQAISRYHQYPDGMILFIGTMFAPVDDRGAPGSGFTHKTGDVVSIGAPELGTLVNEVVACDEAEPWSFGTGALMANLARRGLLAKGAPR